MEFLKIFGYIESFGVYGEKNLEFFGFFWNFLK